MNSKIDSSIKPTARIGSYLAFLADLITICLFVKDIFVKDLSQQTIISEKAFLQIASIIVIFLFAILLWFYSKIDDRRHKFLYQMFSWFYVVFSALILGMISYRFMTETSYGIGEFLGYIFLVFLVCGLGLGISLFNKVNRLDWFSIPFMIVAFEQIALWIIKINSRQYEFNWFSFGNLFLLVIVVLIVFILLHVNNWRKPYSSDKRVTAWKKKK